MFNMLGNFNHKAEIRESKDEILVGEIVRAMFRKGFPAIQFRAHDDRQQVRFRTVGDDVLHSVYITLDRKTGSKGLSAALFGSKATLAFSAEVKNFLTDPDDLVNMYKTDLANLLKLPVMGGIKLNHELNSVYAHTTMVIDIDDYVMKGEPGARKMVALLDDTIAKLRDKLAPFKKA